VSKYRPAQQYHQVVKAVVSKDFRFVHIDAGIGENGLQRVLTETNEDEILHCFLYPIIDKMVRDEFLDLQGIALTIHITWV
tara:strand:+ start:159 stop:401 length:243 start_codon:yes stop_codon:yes gene_type:complete